MNFHFPERFLSRCTSRRAIPTLASFGFLGWLPAGAAEVVESVANPYGLGALWAQGDGVAKFTLLVLALMSIGSWYVIIDKLLEQSRGYRNAAAVERSFWSHPSLNDAVQSLKDDSPFRQIAERGLESVDKHEGLLGAVDFNTWLGMNLHQTMSRIQNEWQGGLAILATVGSTAPFVGLFGTVWGIYNALVRIGMSGQASIDKVAGPVGESLIMTAVGLAVAVPAVLGYNLLVRRNKALIEQVQVFGHDLHAVLLAQGAR